MINVFLILSLLSLGYAEEGCQLSIDFEKGDLKEPEPLILNGTNHIIYPDEKGILKFSTGQTIILACPGAKNTLDVPWESQTIEATCSKGKKFTVNGKAYPFTSFTCKKPTKSVIKKSGSCLGEFSKIEVGFDISKTLIPVIEICRNSKTDESYYAKIHMTKSIDGYQKNSARPSWVTDKLFSGHVNNFYTKKSQLQTLAKILNSEELAEKYLSKNSLARGHLAPKVDFVYDSEQNTTFSYANCAPQWTSFNGGNWKHIETAVRNFVADNNLKVTIYTGVHGQMTLKDNKDKEQAVFLDIDENNKGYIRVPKFYWKIIYDPASLLAFAIVGVNDPFSKEITKDMFLCKDISDSPDAAWLTKSWNTRKSISQGVSYACSYDDLKKAVATVPDLKVKGILRASRK
ncbi:uncharacterized protein LOC117172193 [Belonocnema kinseyi]|uniref:uncharacterized protein LOC117172193 n=1 Tax=Belonocnema kinseyi TaxID=2817044 RepID=UPI00143DB00F|nr:uncharacterized protein LOC117172193 [Belonocnema kinseyi]XP_033215924.1 uncharacterized protein LOC117172193 [Belonocnema kinseyi]